MRKPEASFSEFLLSGNSKRVTPELLRCLIGVNVRSQTALLRWAHEHHLSSDEKLLMKLWAEFLQWRDQ